MSTAFSSVCPDAQSVTVISTPSHVADNDVAAPISHETAIVRNPPTARATEKGREPLQRIGEVRAQQNISLRTISRRTGIDVRELRTHEEPTCDVPVSILRKWQEALEVPLVDLLEDEQGLSRPVMERAKLVRIMKTTVSLRDACQQNVRLARLAGMLCDQLLDLMPELEEVGSWPQTGSRRGADVMGRIFHEPVSVDSHDLD